MEVVTTWFGAFLLDGDTLVKSYPFPADLPELAQRLRRRREGALSPEEASLLVDASGRRLVTRDRRMVTKDVSFRPEARGQVSAHTAGLGGEQLRILLLEEAEQALRASWDPSIHVEEAVRSMTDLDHVLNLVGERLVSWSSRDAPELEAGDANAAVRQAERATSEIDTDTSLAPHDSDLTNSRRKLAGLYRQIEATRAGLEKALEQSVPRRTPNLSALLGPLLAARLLAKAGGLDRLSRLPSSTIQVLGAEKAFFEHLRGRAPPPRHGLLFLHPQIQSAPKAQRGKLARALAGKAAIAARLDRAGTPANALLKDAFESRARAIRAAPPSSRGARKGRLQLRHLTEQPRTGSSG